MIVSDVCSGFHVAVLALWCLSSNLHYAECKCLLLSSKVSIPLTLLSKVYSAVASDRQASMSSVGADTLLQGGPGRVKTQIAVWEPQSVSWSLCHA